MLRRGVPGALAALVLIGLAVLLIKWALITAAILVVPFGVWWIYDRTSGTRRTGGAS